MSDLLSVGASGVRAYQSALTTTSDNIANAATPGYARRTATLSEVAAASGRVSQGSAATGNGVVVLGINRAADAQRAAAVRTSGADLAKTETSATWLQGIESALTGNQLGDRLTSFFNAAKAVAADPTASTPRAALLESSGSVASAFAATARALDQIATDLDTTADNATTSLETLGASLAKINKGLASVAPNSSAQAQLLDQRDQILDQLSALSDISVVTDTSGRASVNLGGASGPAFVTAGGDVGYVTYVRAATGTVSFAVHLNGNSASLNPNGGALAGIVDGGQRIGAARTELSRIANDFVNDVNTVQAAGRDLDGNPGAALFATGATATDISVVLTSGRGIAAAAVGGGNRDNSNLAALEALRTSGGYETDISGLVAGNATALDQRKTVADAQNAIHDGAITARDQLTGVSLDSEAVDLLRYQQAYQASSKVIQVARDTFQTILDIR
ncbi:flagellar hook-associated protein FlgK [Sphingomonas sp. 28-63-12]|uniref:flagellar hook-associated protein FlgK n=1 Tax=Sphingomonas sp. 28-63-12 TaxID=1970434 RepID=UPI000BD41E6C|nr:MAG: flagellar hook-associated protein FlgK [Sphingomonas sp. 28-63-12]